MNTLERRPHRKQYLRASLDFECIRELYVLETQRIDGSKGFDVKFLRSRGSYYTAPKSTVWAAQKSMSIRTLRCYEKKGSFLKEVEHTIHDALVSGHEGLAYRDKDGFQQGDRTCPRCNTGEYLQDPGTYSLTLKPGDPVLKQLLAALENEYYQGTKCHTS